jgi:hypothetical protein
MNCNGVEGKDLSIRGLGAGEVPPADATLRVGETGACIPSLELIASIAVSSW